MFETIKIQQEVIMNATEVRPKKVRRKALPPIGLNSSDSARYVGISEAMMRKMRSDGSGPKFGKIGSKVIYLRKDLQIWLESKAVS